MPPPPPPLKRRHGDSVPYPIYTDLCPTDFITIETGIKWRLLYVNKITHRLSSSIQSSSIVNRPFGSSSSPIQSSSIVNRPFGSSSSCFTQSSSIVNDVTFDFSVPSLKEFGGYSRGSESSKTCQVPGCPLTSTNNHSITSVDVKWMSTPIDLAGKNGTQLTGIINHMLLRLQNRFVENRINPDTGTEEYPNRLTEGRLTWEPFPTYTESRFTDGVNWCESSGPLGTLNPDSIYVLPMIYVVSKEESDEYIRRISVRAMVLSKTGNFGHRVFTYPALPVISASWGPPYRVGYDPMIF